MTEKTVARQSGQGQAFWMLGGLYEVLVSSDETNGATTVMQFTVPVGMAPPPHAHSGPETVYVVDGTLTYHIGGELIDAGPGSIFHIPAGTTEFFEPTSAAKLVVTYVPGGMDKFFAEAGEPAQRREIPPTPTSPPDVDRLAALGAKYGMTIEAPPS
jgi:quercetin dioxygenase-like cupin family protein